MSKERRKQGDSDKAMLNQELRDLKSRISQGMSFNPFHGSCGWLESELAERAEIRERIDVLKLAKKLNAKHDLPIRYLVEMSHQTLQLIQELIDCERFKEKVCIIISSNDSSDEKSKQIESLNYSRHFRLKDF